MNARRLPYLLGLAALAALLAHAPAHAGAFTDQAAARHADLLARLQQQEQAEQDRLDQLSRIGYAGIAAAALIWLAMYLRYGVEFRATQPRRYATEPLPGWRPFEVGYLLHHLLGPREATATLLDLVQRGALRLCVQKEFKARLGGLLGEVVAEEPYVEVVPGFTGELSESERYFLHDVLSPTAEGGGGRRSLRPPAATQPVEGGRFYEWTRLAASEATERMTTVDPASRTGQMIAATAAAPLVALGATLCAIAERPLNAGLITIAAGLVLAVGSGPILRRNRGAARAVRQWQAFRRYLADFSQMRDRTAADVAVWDQYLVYAIVLGLAPNVEHEFAPLFPYLFQDPYADSATGPLPPGMPSG
jgi:hypothetical protein